MYKHSIDFYWKLPWKATRFGDSSTTHKHPSWTPMTVDALFLTPYNYAFKWDYHNFIWPRKTPPLALYGASRLLPRGTGPTQCVLHGDIGSFLISKNIRLSSDITLRKPSTTESHPNWLSKQILCHSFSVFMKPTLISLQHHHVLVSFVTCDRACDSEAEAQDDLLVSQYFCNEPPGWIFIGCF